MKRGPDVAFSREVAFYTKLMPCFAKFADEKHLTKNDQFLTYPKCYASTIDDENEQYAIILEDLRPQGFKMWDTLKISQLENVQFAMRELGKFHGISIASKDQMPKKIAEFEQFTDIIRISLKSKNMQNMYLKSYDHGIASLESENHKIILGDIKENFLTYFDELLNEESATHFGVICHGIFNFLQCSSI